MFLTFFLYKALVHSRFANSVERIPSFVCLYFPVRTLGAKQQKRIFFLATFWT